MKPTTKLSLWDVFSNPINRNLVLILVFAMIAATTIVTSIIVLYNQF